VNTWKLLPENQSVVSPAARSPLKTDTPSATTWSEMSPSAVTLIDATLSGSAVGSDVGSSITSASALDVLLACESDVAIVASSVAVGSGRSTAVGLGWEVAVAVGRAGVGLGTTRTSALTGVTVAMTSAGVEGAPDGAK